MGGGGGGGGAVNIEMLGRRMIGDGFDEAMMTTSVCHANVPRRVFCPETKDPSSLPWGRGLPKRTSGFARLPDF